MVFVLKPPVEDSKGIIIFTHKERAMIDPKFPLVEASLQALSQRYVIGMHWGWHHVNVEPIPFIEFHLAGKGTLSLKQPTDIPHIPMCSRNFLSDCFRPIPDIEKQWDILMIANRRRSKYVDQFFKVVKEILKARPETTVLVISACPSKEELNPVWDYIEMEDDYQAIFTSDEQKRVTLMALEGKNGTPISQEELARYYNKSKIFTLFSDVEGESRVISEASLCGLPVVVKGWLKGGGLDYLDDNNSKTFHSLEAAPQVFLELLDKINDYRFDVESLQQDLCEKHTAAKLKTYMLSLFNDKMITFKGDCDLTGLANKLPGHLYLTLPEKWRLPSSNDLNSPVSAIQYMSHLLDKQPMSIVDTKRLAALWTFQQLAKDFRKFLKRPGNKLRELKLLPIRR